MHMIGNTSYYVIRKLNTFGTFPTTASNLTLGLQISIETVPNIMERQLHTGNIFLTPCNNVYQSSLVSIKFDGAFSADYYPLFESWIGTTMSSGITTYVNPTGSVSLTVIQLDSENPTKCRYATGCTVKSITINAVSGEYVKMSALLVGKSLSEWTSRPAISGSYPTGPTCHETGVLEIKSALGTCSAATFTFDTLFAPNEIRYIGGSSTPVNNTYLKKSITNTILLLMDPTSATAYEALIGNTSAETLYEVSALLMLNYVPYTTKVSLPDPGNGIWKYSILQKAVYSGSSTPGVSILYV